MSPLVLLFTLSATPPPGIDSVVVYPDRAWVTRTTTVDCGARRTVTFPGVTVAAAQDSIRAQVEGGSVDALRIEKKAKADYSAPYDDAKKKLRALEAEQAVLTDEAERAHAKSELGSHYGQIAAAQVQREMALEKPDVKAWGQAFDVALQTQVQGALAEADLLAKQRDLNHRREALQKKMSDLVNAAHLEDLSVEVVASCSEGRQARVELTYLVGGAGWSASYEAHADDVKGTVELTTFAAVRQASGEDWNAAKLTLSTAVPAQNATPPIMQRLQVHAVEQLPEKKVLVRRDEAVASTEADDSIVSSGEGGRVQVRSQGLSVQLEVPERATLLGDGSEQRLFVSRNTLKATFGLRSAPREQPFVFRVADLTNQAPFPLLPGPLSVFRGASLTARYALPRVAQGAVFHLTFGIEDGLRIKRVVVSELKRDAGAFNTKKRFSYDYRFELANWSKAPVEVELWETLPVSELDDVTVTVAEQTTPGYAMNPSDGIAKWKVKLAAKEQRKLELAYKVEVPNSYETGGN